MYTCPRCVVTTRGHTELFTTQVITCGQNVSRLTSRILNCVPARIKTGKMCTDARSQVAKCVPKHSQNNTTSIQEIMQARGRPKEPCPIGAYYSHVRDHRTFQKFS